MYVNIIVLLCRHHLGLFDEFCFVLSIILSIVFRTMVRERFFALSVSRRVSLWVYVTHIQVEGLIEGYIKGGWKVVHKGYHINYQVN